MMTEKAKGFDLSALDTSVKSADGVEFELKHPVTGDPLGSFMSVCGQDSEQYKKAKDKAAEKLRKRQQEDSRRFSSPSDFSNLAMETALGCLTGWREIVDEGKEVKFSAPNARRIFEKYPFFVGQAAEVTLDRSRFLPGDRG